mmetsp:Transcript_4761/g.8150  ORF Transcript_4761/g.8150 Transcript_4761/m.8150 type:complete len:89 (+) Transcript_4761:217-483(+)
MIMNQSFFPIIGSIFHPAYMMINAVILGNLEPNVACFDESQTFKADFPDKCYDVKINQAAFGIGSSTMSILLLAPNMCYCLSLSNLIP